MSKPLLNYTTSVEVQVTVGQISKILVSHGATSISTEYDRGVPTAVSFTLRSPHGIDAYLLPARIDRVLAVLTRQRKAGQVPPRYATPEQAARVAWRISKDWIEAQLALVESGMVEAQEILLPYQLQNGRTFFDWYEESRKALPSHASGFGPSQR